MKIKLALTALLAAGVAPVASAQFSVNGPGGPVPDRPIDCDQNFVPWGEQPDWAPFSSTVNVPANVTSITHVILNGFNHDSKSEVHAFLTSPNGLRYNVIVRPGYDTPEADNGDFLSGDFDIVPSGATDAWPPCCNFDVPGGQYDQYLDPPGGGWPNNLPYPIANTPLDQITGPGGPWSLTIYDWRSQGICIGSAPALPPSSIGSWTLSGTSSIGPPPPVIICEPGLNGIIACPCGNPPSSAGRGCDNSSGTGGATLAASGTASLSSDTLVFTTGDERPTAFSIVLQGQEELPGGVAFGDGVRCVGENLKRLYFKNAVGGSIVAPSGFEPSVSVRSAALGDTILPGEERRYQVYYRDPLFYACPSPGASSFNVTMGLRVPWIF